MAIAEKPAVQDEDLQRRTAELARANELLRKEVSTRRKAVKALHRRNRELQILQQVSHKLASSLDLEHVIATVLDEARLLLNATGCTLWRPEPDQVHMACWRASGPHRELLSGFVLPMEQGVVGWAVQHRQDVLVPETRTDPRHCKDVDVWTGVEIRCLACALLQIQERFIGVLEVVSDKPGFFTEADLKLLKTLATSAAIAIENARLYDEASELRTLNETIVQNMREGIFLEDEEGQITFANPAAAEMLDCGTESLRGRQWQSLIAPEFLAWVALEGSSRRYETVLRTTSGRRLPVMVSSQPLHDGVRLAGRLITFTDISARKDREETLRRRNRDLSLLNRVIAASVERQTVEQILDAVCREVSLAFRASYTAAALVDVNCDQASVVARYPASGEAGPPSISFPITGAPCFEELARHQRPLILESGAMDPPWPDPLAPQDAASMLLLPLVMEGRIVGCLALSRRAPYTFSAGQADLAEHVAEQVSGSLARAQLNEEQQRLSAAVEQAAEAVLIADGTGSVIYVNPSFEEITGYIGKEITGQDLATIDGELWERLSRSRRWQRRHIHRKSDGSQFIADETSAPVRNRATGEIVSYVLTLRDVTHIVALEEQFYHAQKMEAVGRIAGGIAHDYRNLLTVVEMASAILAMQMDPEDPRQEHVTSIQGASRRARDLTQQLLRFSRRESITPEVLDLNSLIEDMDWLLQCLVDEDIELRTVLSPRPARVRIDLSQMEQVIMNLVINARDAMPEGGTLTLETSNVVLDKAQGHDDDCSQPEEYVLLAIADEGVGMDDEVQNHLFQPFFTTKERGKGTGLGLTTVWSILEENGGHVEVDSQLGHGSTFRIYLPRAAQEGASEQPASERKAQPAARYPLGTAPPLRIATDS